MRSRILVVARDVSLRARLARMLGSAGYGVELAESAAHARRIGSKGCALVLVDAEGLGADGKTLVAELQAAMKPLVLLTGVVTPSGRSELGHNVLDLADEGALLGRVAEALRPAPELPEPDAPPVLRFAGFTLDLAGHCLTDATGADVPLTRGEFALLREFAQRPGRVLSRDHLLGALAGREAEAYDRSIDMLVSRLRRKIEPDPKRPTLIVTVPGSGYKLAARGEHGAAASAFEAPHLPGRSTMRAASLGAALGYPHLVASDEDCPAARRSGVPVRERGDAAPIPMTASQASGQLPLPLPGGASATTMPFAASSGGPDGDGLAARPSLRALRAFAEVTATGSVASAARALGVSPSAVSHVLRELERTMGATLFVGPGPWAPLSEAGERLRRGLGRAFEAIDGAVTAATRQSGEVRVSTLSTFSTLWLIPRLGRYYEASPEARLTLSTDTRPVDLTTEPYDCAIRNGRGRYSDLDVSLLFRERLVAVAIPHLLDGDVGLDRLPRLAARVRPNDWHCVLSALGLPASLTPAMTFETRGQAVQAALAGLGVAVIDRTLVQALIDAGKLALAVPDAPDVDLPLGFFFVCRADKARDRHVREFRDWLVSEVAGGPGSGAAATADPENARACRGCGSTFLPPS